MLTTLSLLRALEGGTCHGPHPRRIPSLDRLRSARRRRPAARRRPRRARPGGVAVRRRPVAAPREDTRGRGARLLRCRGGAERGARARRPAPAPDPPPPWGPP